MGEEGSSNPIEFENLALDLELGLPNCEDLIPLSQPLLPQNLAFAFNVSPEPLPTSIDVSRASHTTLPFLRTPCISQPSQSQKKTRLVWTPQLHKRFIDVIAHLGLKNAVPKTIMQMMNVDGLTRENVASHLQKYRIYLKRMQTPSADDPSPSHTSPQNAPAIYPVFPPIHRPNSQFHFKDWSAKGLGPLSPPRPS